MRTGNPVLKEDTFTRSDLERDDTSSVMTVPGTVIKTGLSVGIVVAAASFVWWQLANGGAPLAFGCMAGGAICGFILALITCFKPSAAPITTPLYAVAEGLLLGGISASYEARYPGIVLNSVGLTLGTLVALLAAYTSGVIKVTESLRLGIVAATGAIALVYFVTFIMGLFGFHGLHFIHEAGPIGIGFSLVVVTIAAFNLVLDFDLVERGVSARAPKYMEWYGAFALLVTLVWLYLEILRLLAKLQSRSSRSSS